MSSKMNNKIVGKSNITRRSFLQALGFGTAALAVPGVLRAGVSKKPKPNIIFILADDLGYGDLGCYGQQKILTPNIDKMASEGMRFTQAYAGSCVCAPSRCSLITGKHNGHNRIRDNLPHNIWLRPDDFTVAELLKQAGYKTGAIGKWSLGNPGSWGVPNYQGFDYWYGQLSQDLAIDYYPSHLWENDEIDILQKLVMVNDVGIMKGNRGGKRVFYTDDVYTEKALDFIERNKEQQFFVYLAYAVPHYSDQPKDSPDHFMVPSDEPYSNRRWPQAAKNYAAMITRLDGYVGRVMGLLKKLGIEENTIIFLSSDNGAYQSSEIPRKHFGSNGILKGGKRDFYEGGIRVPFIARWPGKIAPCRVNDHIFAFWDFMPTAAELSGLPIPEDTDGISILPTLLAKEQESHEHLYWDYGHVRQTYKQAVRMGKWKGLMSSDDKSMELYNLEEDPCERKNVASEQPQIVSQIKRIMKTAVTPSKDYRIVGREKNPEGT